LLHTEWDKLHHPSNIPLTKRRYNLSTATFHWYLCGEG
jgi:hypothetical protein